MRLLMSRRPPALMLNSSSLRKSSITVPSGVRLRSTRPQGRRQDLHSGGTLARARAAHVQAFLPGSVLVQRLAQALALHSARALTGGRVLAVEPPQHVVQLG